MEKRKWFNASDLDKNNQKTFEEIGIKKFAINVLSDDHEFEKELNSTLFAINTIKETLDSEYLDSNVNPTFQLQSQSLLECIEVIEDIKSPQILKIMYAYADDIFSDSYHRALFRICIYNHSLSTQHFRHKHQAKNTIDCMICDGERQEQLNYIQSLGRPTTLDSTAIITRHDHNSCSEVSTIGKTEIEYLLRKFPRNII